MRVQVATHAKILVNLWVNRIVHVFSAFKWVNPILFCNAAGLTRSTTDADSVQRFCWLFDNDRAFKHEESALEIIHISHSKRSKWLTSDESAYGLPSIYMNESLGWQWLAPWTTMQIDTTSLVEQGPQPRLQVVAQHLMGKPKMPQQLWCGALLGGQI